MVSLFKVHTVLSVSLDRLSLLCSSMPILQEHVVEPGADSKPYANSYEANSAAVYSKK